MLSRFRLIPERYGRTDGQICYINLARQHKIDCNFITITAVAGICHYCSRGRPITVFSLPYPRYYRKISQFPR